MWMITTQLILILLKWVSVIYRFTFDFFNRKITLLQKIISKNIFSKEQKAVAFFVQNYRLKLFFYSIVNTFCFFFF